MPKILQMPKAARAPEDESSAASAPKPSPAEVATSTADHHHAGVSQLARWLKLADEVLAEPNDRKRA